MVTAGGCTRGGGPHASRGRAPLVALLCALGVGACASANRALYAPTAAMLDARAPDSFVVEMETSEGTLEILMRRAWSPLAVDRAYHLVTNDFYAGARFYRVVPGFVVQWGFSGDPLLDSIWRREGLDDEPVVGSNVRGTVSFARAGARTRSYTMFINLAANERLDSAAQSGVVGYPPIGEIRSRLDVIDGFYAAYDLPGGVQDSIRVLGNDWIRRAYPQMDSIVGTRVVAEWR